MCSKEGADGAKTASVGAGRLRKMRANHAGVEPGPVRPSAAAARVSVFRLFSLWPPSSSSSSSPQRARRRLSCGLKQPNKNRRALAEGGVAADGQAISRRRNGEMV